MDGILAALDEHKAEDESRLETLKRIIKYTPYVPGTQPQGSANRRAHDWKQLDERFVDVRCQRCGIYDARHQDGTVFSDSSRACIPVDLDKTKTLYLTIRFDGREGLETMEVRAPFEMLDDLRAVCGIDAEAECAAVLEQEINQRRMVRLALARMMGDRKS